MISSLISVSFRLLIRFILIIIIFFHSSQTSSSLPNWCSWFIWLAIGNGQPWIHVNIVAMCFETPVGLLLAVSRVCDCPLEGWYRPPHLHIHATLDRHNVPTCLSVLHVGTILHAKWHRQIAHSRSRKQRSTLSHRATWVQSFVSLCSLCIEGRRSWDFNAVVSSKHLP